MDSGASANVHVILSITRQTNRVCVAFQNTGVDVTTQQAQLHPIPAVQERLSLGRSKVYELMDEGILRSIKIGKRRLVPESAIAEYIDSLVADQCPKESA